MRRSDGNSIGVHSQEREAAAQRKVWEEQKKGKRFEGLFSEEAFDERAAQEDEDGDDFM